MSLVADWRETADRAGFGSEARIAMVKEAQSFAASRAVLSGPSSQAAIADRAVAFAADKLGERQSVFSAAALQEEAGRFALGKASYTQIAAAVDSATKQGELIDRTYLDRRSAAFAGFATRQNVEAETRILAIEGRGRGAMGPIASPMVAAKAVARAAKQSEESGLSWNADQRAATQQLLTSGNRITAVQGYAGTLYRASREALWSR